MVKKSDSLTVRELLKNTYSILCERHRPDRIVFSTKITTEIADDSDGHRIRKGFMGYEQVDLFDFNKCTWAIALGEKCGRYPAEPYDSDILALEFNFDEKIRQIDQLREVIVESSYFRNSLICGMADGILGASENSKFGYRMLERLKPETPRFISQAPEYNRQCLSLSTLSPVCKRSARYKPEFADFLADSIEAVLR